MKLMALGLLMMAFLPLEWIGYALFMAWASFYIGWKNAEERMLKEESNQP